MMRIRKVHSWDVSITEARKLQESLAERVDMTTPLPPWQVLAAADVSFNKYETRLYAAVVVMRAGTFEVLERVGVAGESRFPYVPGLLSFREAPAVLEAFEKLQTPPDVVLCDGQGIAHPRRLGLASHIGLFLDLPTIGCAKSRLCGVYEEPGPRRGDRSALIDHGEVIGAVVRTKDRVQPLFVSPGNHCDMEGAVSVVLQTSTKYRLPVPARCAHAYVNEIRRAVTAGQPIPP
jgi:deoxyribonuclease V